MDSCELPSEHSRLSEFLLSMPPGPIWLFFGCRGAADYLYEKELSEFVESQALTHLEVAMSRVGNNKVYVTHKIREQGVQLVQMLLNNNAYIFVCGDGNHMAKDVFAAFKDVLLQHGPNLNEEEVNGVLAELKSSKRYLQDVWS